MDAVSQRQAILALFILLQSWKFYDWLVDLPATVLQPGSLLLDDLLAFFFKWAALELVFLVAVQWARVPKLMWRLQTRALVWGGMCCVTLGMAMVVPFWMTDKVSTPTFNVDDVAGSRESLIRGLLYFIYFK